MSAYTDVMRMDLSAYESPETFAELNRRMASIQASPLSWSAFQEMLRPSHKSWGSKWILWNAIQKGKVQL